MTSPLGDMVAPMNEQSWLACRMTSMSNNKPLVIKYADLNINNQVDMIQKLHHLDV